MSLDRRHSDDPFLQKVRLTIYEYGMIPKGTGVVAAVSGGPDSVAMLYALVDLSQDQRFRIVVAHFDHGLRSESAREAQFVSELADALGLEYRIERGDVSEYSRTEKVSIEEAGRLLRYDFLERTRKEAGFPVIAVGHHVDDELETFFLRLLRGASLEGLCGIPPVRGNIVRPLTRVNKKQIISFLQQKNISYVVDSSNLADTTERNFIRNVIFPAIQRRFDGFEDCVHRTIRVLHDENQILEDMAQELYQSAVSTRDATLHLDRRKLLNSPLGVRRRVVMKALYSHSRQRSRFVQSHLHLVERLVVGDRPSGCVELPRGTRVQRIYDKITISLQETLPQWQPYLLNIDSPGTYKVPYINIQLLFQTYALTRFIDFNNASIVYFDADQLPFPFVVRGPKPGDRIRPWGLQGSRKIKKFFIETRVPMHVRHVFPLVVKDSQIVWIPSVRRSCVAPISPHTRTVLEVSVLGKPDFVQTRSVGSIIPSDSKTYTDS